MTNREKLQADMEDSILALMMDDFAQSEGERFIEENERLKQDPNAAVPEDVERRDLRLIERELAKNERRRGGRQVLRILGHFAAAAVIVTILFGTALALSPAVRAGTMNLLMQIDERVASWQFGVGEDRKLKENIDIIVAWLPEGYSREKSVVSGPSDIVIDCANEKGELIRVSVHDSKMSNHTIDLEESDYSDITIQGCQGLLINKNDTLTIDWVYNETNYVIAVESSSVDIDTLIRVAESVNIIT